MIELKIWYLSGLRMTIHLRSQIQNFEFFHAEIVNCEL